MNSLLDYLMKNPGLADYMDIESGDIVHTGGYGASFGFIPVSNVDGTSKPPIIVDPVVKRDYSLSKMNEYILAYESKDYEFELLTLNETESNVIEGSFLLNGVMVTFKSFMNVCARFVGHHSPKLLQDIMSVTTSDVTDDKVLALGMMNISRSL